MKQGQLVETCCPVVCRSSATNCAWYAFWVFNCGTPKLSHPPVTRPCDSELPNQQMMMMQRYYVRVRHRHFPLPGSKRIVIDLQLQQLSLSQLCSRYSQRRMTMILSMWLPHQVRDHRCGSTLASTSRGDLMLSDKIRPVVNTAKH